MTLLEKYVTRPTRGSDPAATWFSPFPAALSASRLDQRYRDLLVPGIGRVWFVQQLSSAVAALRLHATRREAGEPRPSPIAIAHGIEALGCELEYGADPDSRRVFAKRAFGRDVIDRLFVPNAERAEEERTLGLGTNRRRVPTARTSSGSHGRRAGRQEQLCLCEDTTPVLDKKERS